MSPEDRNKICLKCTNRQMDWNTGVFCGITGSKPLFENECLDYNQDKKIARKEEELKKQSRRREFLLPTSRLIKEGEIKVKILSQIFQKNVPVWSKYKTYYELPETVIVGSKSFLLNIVVCSIVLFTLIAYAFLSEPKGIILKTIIGVLIFFVSSLLIQFIYAAFLVKRDRKQYIQIDRKGLLLEGKERIVWQDIKSFSFINGWVNRCLSDYLVLNMVDEEKVYFDCKNLELKRSQIGHLLKLHLALDKNDCLEDDKIDVLSFEAIRKRKFVLNFKEIGKDEYVIKNRNYKWLSIIYFCLVFVLPVSFLTYSGIFKNWEGISSLPILLTSLLSGIPFYFVASSVWETSKNVSIKLRISKKGIQLLDKNWTSWSDIETIGFGKIKGGNRNNDYLILQTIKDKQLTLLISDLSVSKVKLEQIILKFRTK